MIVNIVLTLVVVFITAVSLAGSDTLPEKVEEVLLSLITMFIMLLPVIFLYLIWK